MVDLVALGLIIAAEPLPVIGFILVLSTERGPRNGAAFIVGWVACLALVAATTVLLTGGSPPQRSSSPGLAISVGKLALGLALIGYGVVRFVRRSTPRPTKAEPAWMRRVDRLQPAGAAWLGVLLQPWPLVAAGVALILDANMAKLVSVVSLVAFVVLATWSFLVMELLFLRDPLATRARLERVRSWLLSHRTQLITGLAIVVGGWLGLSATLALV